MMARAHNRRMKKITFALCSLLLLASCAGASSEDEGKTYIASFKNAYEASYSSGSLLVNTTPNGAKVAAGVKNLSGTYYRVSGSGLAFEAGVDGLKGDEVSSLKGELLLTGGSISLDTNSSSLGSIKDFMKLSPVKAKAYFGDGALYFNASGENRGEDTNSTLGLLAQTAIQEISGDSSYRLYGGYEEGSLPETKNRYKGKWTLSEENAKKISDKMPFIKEGDTLSEHFSLSSFIEGAYEDADGKTAFSFSTKDDGTKRIQFQSKDKKVLSAALAAGFKSFSLTLSSSESLPSENEVKEKIDEFFTYAEPLTFSISTFFTDKGLSQVSYDVNFSLDEAKINETYPQGMFDLTSSAPEGGKESDYRFNLDGSLTFSGTLNTRFGSEGSFSLPDLSSYLEFPAIKKSSAETN